MFIDAVRACRHLSTGIAKVAQRWASDAHALVDVPGRPGERVHAVFVIDETERPVGVVSDLDLLAGEWLADDEARLETTRAITAAEIMSSPVQSVDAHVDVRDAARHMRELGVHRLLVTDGDRSVGVLSISDLVAELGRTAGGPARTVRDVMSSAFVTAGPDTSVAATARAMTERRSRSVVVIDSSCKPLGMVTGFDLLAALEGDEQMRDRPICGLMTDRILAIAPGSSLREAADLMLEHEVHRLVVIEDGAPSPVGLIRTTDIVVEMARRGSRWEPRRPTGDDAGEVS